MVIIVFSLRYLYYHAPLKDANDHIDDDQVSACLGGHNHIFYLFYLL